MEKEDGHSMTSEQAKGVLRVCRAGWPHSFASMSKEDAAETLRLWSAMFADDDARLVGAAVKALLASGNLKFAPTIGDVKEAMRRLVGGDDATELEAWSKIKRAVRNGIYCAQEEFARLSPELQRLVGSPEQLRSWAMLDESELDTVVASNVQRSFRAAQAQMIERQKLPANVAAVVSELAAAATKALPDA